VTWRFFIIQATALAQLRSEAALQGACVICETAKDLFVAELSVLRNIFRDWRAPMGSGEC